jgi:hypothetical protein
MTETIAEKLDFPPGILEKLGAVSIMSAKIEYLTEQIIWAFKNENPQGKRPSTDALSISALLTMLQGCGAAISDSDIKSLLAVWLPTVKAAFRCRNTLMHGVVLKSKGSDTFDFITHTQWEGEKRQRQSATFLANEHTVSLLVDVFEKVLQGALFILAAAKGELNPIQHVLLVGCRNELQNARSTVIELADLPTAFNHEKY